MVPYVALASVPRRSRGYAVRRTSTPGRGGGGDKCEHSAETRKVRQYDCVATCQNKPKTISRLNETHQIIAPRLQTEATAFGPSAHLDPALLAVAQLADRRRTSCMPLTGKIPPQVVWRQVAG